MQAKTKFETLVDFELVVGESPVWDEARGLLWFIDVVRPAAYSLDTTTGKIVDYPMPQTIGSLGLVSDGRLIVALRNGVHFFDPTKRQFEFLVHPEPDRTMNRLNDGKVGPDGCFWVGSMHDAQPRRPTARLYRVDSQGEATVILDGLRVSNGLAWSPDGRIMYHSDSRGPIVRAFDFDPVSGAVSNQRTMAVLDEKIGLPDGAAVDRDGCYWSAGVTSGVLNRFSSEGVLLESIDLPATSPTMPCFGGPDMKTLFVTSLSSEQTPGTLLSFRVGVAGLPTQRFTVSASRRQLEHAR